MNEKKTLKKQILSRSLLQEEIGSNRIMKLILLFLTGITVFFIYWSTNVQLNEVVVAEGEIEPLTNIVQVQHAEGGKISEIFVLEQSWVNKGDPLLKIDDSIVNLQIQEVESDLYYLRQQRDLLLEELAIQDKLYNEKLTSTSEYLALQRDVADIKGRIIVAMKRIERYRLLSESSVLYASMDGRVQGLGNRGAGSVIKAGETVFSIIPDDLQYVAKIRIPASKIGRIETGLPVMLKFSAYDFSRYGGVLAELDEISATTFLDNQKQPYYQALVHLPQDYVGKREDDNPILQGMTLNAEIRIGKKTLFEYLFLPVKASGNSAFKEP